AALLLYCAYPIEESPATWRLKVSQRLSQQILPLSCAPFQRSPSPPWPCTNVTSLSASSLMIASSPAPSNSQNPGTPRTSSYSAPEPDQPKPHRKTLGTPTSSVSTRSNNIGGSAASSSRNAASM